MKRLIFLIIFILPVAQALHASLATATCQAQAWEGSRISLISDSNLKKTLASFLCLHHSCQAQRQVLQSVNFSDCTWLSNIKEQDVRAAAWLQLYIETVHG